MDVHPVDKGRLADFDRRLQCLCFVPRIYLQNRCQRLDADALMAGDAVELMKRVFRGGHKTCGVAVVPREMKIRSSTGLSEEGCASSA